MANILHQWRILVVEDDNFLSKAYTLKIEKAGYTVKTCADGAEALKELPNFAPDLIILDLVMPKMDGFSFLAQLKNMNLPKKPSIIVATNLGEKSDIDKAISLGAADYVVKSDMSMNGLLEKIEKHLGTAQAGS